MLYIRLRNAISVSSTHAASSHAIVRDADQPVRDPCAGGTMTAASTNLHFHGLALPPVCHQDETLKTLIQPGDPPFEYRVRIPESQPPGLYWYHPHVHGFSEDQLLGGASGALIVEGIEGAVPSVKGLRERVLVIRDEWMSAPTASDRADPKRPTKQLSLNYVPVPYPKYPPGVINMRPGERELWRVLNASADTYINLHVEFGGKRQSLQLVALDGVPLRYGEPDAGSYVPGTSFVFLPPASRAEFIITAPSEGESGRLMTGFVYRGADEDAPRSPKSTVPAGVRAGQDDVDAARPLASIAVSANAAEPAFIQTAAYDIKSARAPLSGVRPARSRTLYFSEKLSNPTDPSSATLFFITEEGHTPAVFDPAQEKPNITVHQGDVEDWTIENRSRETHTFHIHQLHFIVVSRRGVTWEEPTLRDTINVPAWNGFGHYPSLTLRMDFRDPNIAGTLPFHCHIAQHLDGGMMGTVRIDPKSKD
jgi:FtsP/CotA-like multicopper oxidase with cupredoxin domain